MDGLDDNGLLNRLQESGSLLSGTLGDAVAAAPAGVNAVEAWAGRFFSSDTIVLIGQSAVPAWQVALPATLIAFGLLRSAGSGGGSGRRRRR